MGNDQVLRAVHLNIDLFFLGVQKNTSQCGGKENVKEVGYCATRLRFEVKDNAKVDEKAVKAAGAAGVIRPSKNACQVIIGTKVQFVYDELKKML